MQEWWVYMLRCADQTLYTGISTEPARRFHEHNYSPKGARYTRARRPVQPVLLVPAGDRASASRLEARLKRLTRGEKQQLLASLRDDKRKEPLSFWIEGAENHDTLA
ncbi:MAG: GIY-YIG nuclease family protein [Alcanivorax sp.]|uniref:GIY-YIG nuclease family protein n=1 Tax=Alcanivorax sp. IL2 TaxID=3396310 RepID=UPI001A61E68F|nr:GIY-YIG nuclease family protein [Alcanivorax sp.]